MFKLQTGGKKNPDLLYQGASKDADEMGVEVVCLRVAGGNAQYVLNHLLSIDSLLHFTEVLIVQHTGTLFPKEGLTHLS